MEGHLKRNAVDMDARTDDNALLLTMKAQSCIRIVDDGWNV